MSLHSALSINVMYSSNFFISSAFSSSVTCTSGRLPCNLLRQYLTIRKSTQNHIAKTTISHKRTRTSRKSTVSKVSISLYEHGLNTPSLEIIETVSKYYDITIDMLMHSEPDELKNFIEKRRTPNPLARLIPHMRV